MGRVSEPLRGFSRAMGRICGLSPGTVVQSNTNEEFYTIDCPKEHTVVAHKSDPSVLPLLFVCRCKPSSPKIPPIGTMNIGDIGDADGLN